MSISLWGEKLSQSTSADKEACTTGLEKRTTMI